MMHLSEFGRYLAAGLALSVIAVILLGVYGLAAWADGMVDSEDRA